jgi:hypothetical protein
MWTYWVRAIVLHYVTSVGSSSRTALMHYVNKVTCSIVLLYVTSVGFRTALMHYVDKCT